MNSSIKPFVFVLIMISIFSCNEYKSGNIKSKNENSNLEKIAYVYKEAYENSIRYDGVKLNDQQSSILSKCDFIQNNTKWPLVVLRYSETSCNSCIDEGLFLLNDLKKSGFSTLVLCSYQNERHQEIYFKRRKIEIDVCNVSENYFAIFSPYETSKIPYILIVDENLTVHCFFALTYKSKGLLDGYKKMILKKFIPNE